MASLQALTFNAGDWFFSPLELWCDEAWSCQSFLSFFLLFIHLCTFFCDLRTVHLLIVVTKPSDYYRKQTRHEQTSVSHTHTGFYTGFFVSSSCMFAVALDSHFLCTWPVRGQRQGLCAASEPFEKAHQAFMKSWKAPAEAVKMCKDSSAPRVKDSFFLWRRLSCSSLFFSKVWTSAGGSGAFLPLLITWNGNLF